MQLTKFIAVAFAGLLTSTAARPIPCPTVSLQYQKYSRAIQVNANGLLPYSSSANNPQNTLDLIMLGKLPSDACCSYGSCIGHVNVSGIKGVKKMPTNIEEFSEEGKR